MKKLLIILIIASYISAPVLASESIFLDFAFYTYPDFELKHMKVGLAITDNRWGVSIIDTDADLSSIQGVYVMKDSALDNFFAAVMSKDYEDRKLVKTLVIGDLELMRWTSHDETFWLWRF